MIIYQSTNETAFFILLSVGTLRGDARKTLIRGTQWGHQVSFKHFILFHKVETLQRDAGEGRSRRCVDSVTLTAAIVLYIYSLWMEMKKKQKADKQAHPSNHPSNHPLSFSRFVSNYSLS